MRFCCWIVCAGGLMAQSLSISPVSAAPGGKTAVEVSVNSPGGSEPLALQWELDFPAQPLVIEPGGPRVAAEAQRAGKSLACTGRWKKAPRTYAYACILAGGQKPIPNGPVAILPFRVAPDAKAGILKIHLERSQAINASRKKVPVKNVEGAVTITR